MRKVINVLLGLVLLLLVGCSGSDTYRGLWKATDANGEKFEITFEAKSFSIKNSTGKVSTYKYAQNSVSIENSVETYGIHLDDGRNYLINFPIANDESKGVIKSEDGNLLYAISKGDYISSEDIYKLK